MTNIIVNFGAVFNVFTIIITITSLIVARRYDDERPSFVAPGGKVMPWIVLVILVLCNLSSILNGGLALWIYTLVFFTIGFLIYYLQKLIKE